MPYMMNLDIFTAMFDHLNRDVIDQIMTKLLTSHWWWWIRNEVGNRTISISAWDISDNFESAWNEVDMAMNAMPCCRLVVDMTSGPGYMVPVTNLMDDVDAFLDGVDVNRVVLVYDMSKAMW